MRIRPGHRPLLDRRLSAAAWLAGSWLLTLIVAGTAAMVPLLGHSESETPVLGPDPVLVPVAVTWTTGGGRWVGYWGRRESVLCPGGGHIEGVWGTDIYTDDSSICTAAVHAGLLTTKDGGTVTIEMRPDAGQYGGSVRNGVRTGDWMEPWTGAYVFVRNRQTAEPAIAATSVSGTRAARP